MSLFKMVPVYITLIQACMQTQRTSNNKHIINELKVSTIQNKSKHYTQQSLITIMLIFSPCLITVMSGNPFVKGSTIMRFVLLCSIDTFYFRTSSFKTKYFNFICLAPLEYLSFLEKNIVVKLSQYIFSSLTILLIIPSPEIKFRNQLA